jgi:hypothetical protein
MATSCILGKRKSRCKNDDEFLLDPDYTRSHEPVKRRGMRLFRSIASLFGFGKKKDGTERIEYQELVKEESPFQWMEPIGIETKEKSVSAMGVLDQVKNKRPRLEDLLGWNLRFVEKEGLETEIRE